MSKGAIGNRQAAARLAVFALTSFAFTLPAHAALGAIEASVFADQAQSSATLRTVYASAYTMHELQVPAGATVREYVSPSGVVFAIAWQGPTMPDLRQLLGTRFAEYVDAVAAARKARGPVSIQLPDLVVQSGGHMRAFSGRAYLPAAMPAGITAEDVR